ncbi:MAG: CHAD domain-containing protein [Roseovarius sp.]
MGYRLKKSDKTLTAAIRRIAREQIDRALTAIDRPGDNREGIHEARACCKKLRGLIRLVRPCFPAFDLENAAFRDAAKGLEALRAGGAGRETLDRLAASAPAGLDLGVLTEIRAGFDAENVPALVTDRAADIAAFRAHLCASRDRLDTWTLAGKGFAPVRKGLKKNYAQACDGFKRARKSGAPEAFHDWRKSVKYHWYHAQLLRGLKPKRIAPQRAHAKALGEVLGDHHDLFDLRAHLREGAFAPKAVARLQEPIMQEMARLEARALAIGALLLADHPNTLARRWQGWWKAW